MSKARKHWLTMADSYADLKEMKWVFIVSGREMFADQYLELHSIVIVLNIPPVAAIFQINIHIRLKALYK